MFPVPRQISPNASRLRRDMTQVERTLRTLIAKRRGASIHLLSSGATGRECYNERMHDQDGESINELGVFFPKGSTRCTEDFSKFLNEFRSHADFFFFVCHIVGKVDKNRVVAAKALLSGARDDEEKRRYEETINKPDIALKELQKHSKILSRNLTNGIVNSFQRYFSSIIQSAALKNPVVLSSSHTVKLTTFLNLPSIEIWYRSSLIAKSTSFHMAVCQIWKNTLTTA